MYVPDKEDFLDNVRAMAESRIDPEISVVLRAHVDILDNGREWYEVGVCSNYAESDDYEELLTTEDFGRAWAYWIEKVHWFKV